MSCPLTFRPKPRDRCYDSVVRDITCELNCSTLECGFGSETQVYELPLSSCQPSFINLVTTPKDKKGYLLDFNIVLSTINGVLDSEPVEITDMLSCLESLRFEFEFDGSFPVALEYHSVCSIRVPSVTTSPICSESKFKPALDADVTIRGRTLTIRIIPGLVLSLISELLPALGISLTGILELLTIIFAQELCFSGQIAFTRRSKMICE